MKQRKLTTSVRAILVRDFNWRMGDLRRILMSANRLDPDLRDQVRELVYMQMDRERAAHEGRLMAEKAGDVGGLRLVDRTYANAIHAAEYNKWWNEIVAQQNPS